MNLENDGGGRPGRGKLEEGREKGGVKRKKGDKLDVIHAHVPGACGLVSLEALNGIWVHSLGGGGCGFGGEAMMMMTMTAPRVQSSPDESNQVESGRAEPGLEGFSHLPPRPCDTVRSWACCCCCCCCWYWGSGCASTSAMLNGWVIGKARHGKFGRGRERKAVGR